MSILDRLFGKKDYDDGEVFIQRVPPEPNPKPYDWIDETDGKMHWVGEEEE